MPYNDLVTSLATLILFSVLAYFAFRHSKKRRSITRRGGTGMFPLSGYDTGVDAIYTRGPWMQRLEEIAENQERTTKKR